MDARAFQSVPIVFESQPLCIPRRTVAASEIRQNHDVLLLREGFPFCFLFCCILRTALVDSHAI